MNNNCVMSMGCDMLFCLFIYCVMEKQLELPCSTFLSACAISMFSQARIFSHPSFSNRKLLERFYVTITWFLFVLPRWLIMPWLLHFFFGKMLFACHFKNWIIWHSEGWIYIYIYISQTFWRFSSYIQNNQ